MFQSDKVGVIVARFQVASLHQGHRHLLSKVREVHQKVLVVLGDHGGLRTDRDPLTYDERADMVREYCGGQTVKIARLRDHPFSHERWSAWLDELIENEYKGSSAVPYCSRGGFIDLYSGKWKSRAQFIEPFDESSGTAHRAGIKRSRSMTWREMLICEQRDRPPITYSTADVAIMDDDLQQVLVGTKHWFDGKYALIGGFSDPADKTDKKTAIRERGEEAKGIRTGRYMQMGPRMQVDDPRYRNSKDKIMTTLFRTPYRSGDPVADDDIKAVRWAKRSELTPELIVPWHLPQVARIEAYWRKKIAA